MQLQAHGQRALLRRGAREGLTDSRAGQYLMDSERVLSSASPIVLVPLWRDSGRWGAPSSATRSESPDRIEGLTSPRLR